MVDSDCWEGRRVQSLASATDARGAPIPRGAVEAFRRLIGNALTADGLGCDLCRDADFNDPVRLQFSRQLSPIVLNLVTMEADIPDEIAEVTWQS